MGARLWGQKPQPFHETRLGRLPAEVRQMIYQHVLIASPSQSRIILRRPKVPDTETEPSKDTAADASLAGVSNEAAEEIAPHATLTLSERQKMPNIAILQICRRVSQEAHYIFYATNSCLIIGGAKNLNDFLLSLEPDRRNVLKSLYIGDILTPVSRYHEKHLLEPLSATGGANPVAPVARKSCRQLGVDGHQAIQLLRGCKNLRKIQFEMESYDDVRMYVIVPKAIFGWHKTQIDMMDGSHWVMRPSFNEVEWNYEQFRGNSAYKKLWRPTHQLEIIVDNLSVEYHGGH